MSDDGKWHPVPSGPAPEEVTVCYSEQKFSPVSYHVFGVGSFFYKTIVRPGETPLEAMARAYEVCEAMARAAYPRARNDYFERVRDAASHAKKGQSQ